MRRRMTKEEIKRFEKANWINHLLGDDPLMKEIIIGLVEVKYGKKTASQTSKIINEV